MTPRRGSAHAAVVPSAEEPQDIVHVRSGGTGLRSGSLDLKGRFHLQRIVLEVGEATWAENTTNVVIGLAGVEPNVLEVLQGQRETDLTQLVSVPLGDRPGDALWRVACDKGIHVAVISLNSIED